MKAAHNPGRPNMIAICARVTPRASGADKRLNSTLMGDCPMIATMPPGLATGMQLPTST